MSRTKEELIKDLINIKGKYRLEFQREFPSAIIKDLVATDLKFRHETFVNRYLNHYPNIDLHNFEQLLIEDIKTPFLAIPKVVEPKVANATKKTT